MSECPFPVMTTRRRVKEAERLLAAAFDACDDDDLRDDMLAVRDKLNEALVGIDRWRKERPKPSGPPDIVCKADGTAAFPKHEIVWWTALVAADGVAHIIGKKFKGGYGTMCGIEGPEGMSKVAKKTSEITCEACREAFGFGARRKAGPRRGRSE